MILQCNIVSQYTNSCPQNASRDAEDGCKRGEKNCKNLLTCIITFSRLSSSYQWPPLTDWFEGEGGECQPSLPHLMPRHDGLRLIRSGDDKTSLLNVTYLSHLMSSHASSWRPQTYWIRLQLMLSGETWLSHPNDTPKCSLIVSCS